MSLEPNPRADRVESTDLGHPALRRDELVALAALVRDACAGDLAIGLTDGGDEVGRDPASFAEHADRTGVTEPDELFLSGRRGRTRVTVILGRDSRVRVTNPDEDSRRAVAAMVEAVRGHQRRFTDRAWNGVLLGLLGLVGTIGYAGVIVRQGLLGTGYGLGVVALLVVTLGCVLWGQSHPSDGEGARILNTPRRR
ncbi:hypothetical protein [Nocardiopsis sp. MG754419]|uniref:hypothetical protein n=1 Tax=Nocardiopsis sp. MG754419 TaxID=2259865 RepID=UPI001BA775B5|nr:hypothetical protein [Nocardiopsis sp. MG754419]MBR8743345.1 hypothetical protein [Nocardiopsis sp. MG754419]